MAYLIKGWKRRQVGFTFKFICFCCQNKGKYWCWRRKFYIITQTSPYKLPGISLLENLLIISLPGQPAASETQDSISSALSRKFRKPLVTSSQCWSQWETDKRKKRQSSKRHIRFLLLSYSIKIICRDQILFFLDDSQYENLINSLYFNRHDNKNLLGVRAPAVTCECVHVGVIIFMREIPFSL